MLFTMKAPANREKGQRTVRCTEVQANILRKVGWTEVEVPNFFEEAVKSVAPAAEVVNFYIEEMEAAGSPPEEQTISPDPVNDPDVVRPFEPVPDDALKPKADSPYLQQTDYKLSELKKPKRTYHRRTVNVEPDGKVSYKVKPPKRRYRRRDLTAEE